MKKLLFLLVVLFVCIKAFAVSFCMVNYNVKDGLPSSQVYCALQDSLGFMWFGTDRGISRFDGKEFENFTDIEGVTENVFVWLRLDEKNRVWARSLNGTIVCFENGKFHAPEWNSILKGYYEQRNLFEDFATYGNYLVFLLFKEGKKDNQFTILLIDSETARVKSFEFNTPNNLFCIKVANSYLTSLSNSSDRAESFGRINKLCTGTLKLNGYLNNDIRIQKNSNTICLLLKDKVLELDENIGKFDTIDLKSYQIFDMCKLPNDKVFYGTNQGLIFEEKGNIQIVDELKGKHIVDVQLDCYGGLWITTLNDGIYFIENYNFKKVELPHSLSDANFTNGVGKWDDLWLWTNNKEFVHLTSLSVDKVIKRDDAFVYSLANIGHNRIVFCGDSSILDKGQVITSSKYSKFYLVKFIPDTSYNGALFCYYRNGIFLLDKTSFDTINMHRFPEYERVLSFYKINESSCYIGTSEALYRFNQDLELLGVSKLNCRVQSIKVRDGVTYLATTNLGILLMKNNQVFDTISEKDGLLSNSVNDMELCEIDNPKCILAATNQGLSILKNTDVNSTYQIENYKNIVDNYFINSILQDDSMILLCGTRGVSFIKTDELMFRNCLPKVRIRQIEINGKSVPIDSILQTKIELNANENSLYIAFDNSLYSSNMQNDYAYSIVKNGNLSSWESVRGSNINFLNLNYGNYSLFIKSTDSLPVSLSFKIKKHFTQTWLFRISVFLIALISIFSIVFFIFKNKQKQHKLEFDSYDFRQKALQSQMNPHFIFNALNSIQFYFLSRDKESSNDYLTMFAQLFRKILDMSRRDEVSVQEEIELLENYLYLEKMRFLDKFDYQIEVDEAVDKKMKIPSLLIQPIVENAVVHGIATLDEGGMIRVTFNTLDKYLVVQIRDNGEGINARQESRNLRKSVGMKNVKSRIEVLNKLNEPKRIILETLDLSVQQDHGTLVIFRFPLKHV